MAIVVSAHRNKYAKGDNGRHMMNKAPYFINNWLAIRFGEYSHGMEHHGAEIISFKPFSYFILGLTRHEFFNLGLYNDPDNKITFEAEYIPDYGKTFRFCPICCGYGTVERLFTKVMGRRYIHPEHRNAYGYPSNELIMNVRKNRTDKYLVFKGKHSDNWNNLVMSIAQTTDEENVCPQCLGTGLKLVGSCAYFHELPYIRKRLFEVDFTDPKKGIEEIMEITQLGSLEVEQ